MDFTCEADVDAAKKNYLEQVQRKRSGRDSDDDSDEDGAKKLKKPKPDVDLPDPKDEFKTFALNLPANAYPHLRKTVTLEPTGCHGQQGCVLVHPDPENGTPIVRSTTKLKQPAQIFQPLHHQLANEITMLANIPIPLNNCLVEVMEDGVDNGEEIPFESKQAQDLVFCEDSYICLFSCYKDPKVEPPPRKLVIESKTDTSITFEIPLKANSVVVWSLETNSYYRHKIVPTTAKSSAEAAKSSADNNDKKKKPNVWMGFTFRTSSTCIRYGKDENDDTEDGGQTRAYFANNGMPLVLLKGERACSTIHRLRELENEGTTFVYPSCLMSTISPGDLLPPVDHSKTGKDKDKDKDKNKDAKTK